MGSHPSVADGGQTQDIVSGDEIISDTWEMKEIDDVVYEIDCKKVTKGGVDVGQSMLSERLRSSITDAIFAEHMGLIDFWNRYWRQSVR